MVYKKLFCFYDYLGRRCHQDSWSKKKFYKESKTWSLETKATFAVRTFESTESQKKGSLSFLFSRSTDFAFDHNSCPPGNDQNWTISLSVDFKS